MTAPIYKGSSVSLEMMVSHLFANEVIPRDFDMSRALFTCLAVLVSRDRATIYLRDSKYLSDETFVPGAPSDEEKSRLAKNRRPAGFPVIVDPVAPFSNIAKNADTEEAWRKLTKCAGVVCRFLDNHGVIPYREFLLEDIRPVATNNDGQGPFTTVGNRR